MEDQFLGRKTCHAIAGHNQLPSSHEESVFTGFFFLSFSFFLSFFFFFFCFLFCVCVCVCVYGFPCSQPAQNFVFYLEKKKKQKESFVSPLLFFILFLL